MYNFYLYVKNIMKTHDYTCIRCGQSVRTANVDIKTIFQYQHSLANSANVNNAQKFPGVEPVNVEHESANSIK